jgi:hypothetical protein
MFVSQRGVLIKHDGDLRAKIRGEVAQALELADHFPAAVCDLIHQAFVKSDRLFGLDDALDALVYRWFRLSDEQRSEVVEAVAMARQLRELV